MNEKKIYGVTALFDKPDEIISAAKAVNAEYKRYDVHTPYPIHGMPKAMKLKWSPLGYFALAFGLTGTAIDDVVDNGSRLSSRYWWETILSFTGFYSCSFRSYCATGICWSRTVYVIHTV